MEQNGGNGGGNGQQRGPVPFPIARLTSTDGLLQRPDSSHFSAAVGFQFRPGPTAAGRSKNLSSLVVGGSGDSMSVGNAPVVEMKGKGKGREGEGEGEWGGGVAAMFGGLVGSGAPLDVASLLMPPPPLPVHRSRSGGSGDGGAGVGDGGGREEDRGVNNSTIANDGLLKERNSNGESAEHQKRKRTSSLTSADPNSRPSTPNRQKIAAVIEKRPDTDWDIFNIGFNAPPSAQPKSTSSKKASWDEGFMDFGMPLELPAPSKIKNSKPRPSAQAEQSQKAIQLERYDMPFGRDLDAKLQAEAKRERVTELHTNRTTSEATVIEIDDNSGDEADAVLPRAPLLEQNKNGNQVSNRLLLTPNSDRHEKSIDVFSTSIPQRRLGPPVASRRPRPDLDNDEPNRFQRPQFSATGHMLSRKLQDMMGNPEPEQSRKQQTNKPTTATGAQQLSMALVQLTAEKTLLEETNEKLLKEYNSQYEELRAAKMEIQSLKQAAHRRADMEKDRFEEVTAGIMAEFLKLNNEMREFRVDIRQLHQNDGEFSNKAGEILNQGNEIRAGLEGFRDGFQELKDLARKKEDLDEVLKRVEAERDLALQSRDQLQLKLSETLETLETTGQRVFALEDLMAKNSEQVEKILRSDKEKVEGLFIANQESIENLITRNQRVVESVRQASSEMQQKLEQMCEVSSQERATLMEETVQCTERQLGKQSETLEKSLITRLQEANSTIIDSISSFSNGLKEAHSALMNETEKAREAILEGQQMLARTVQDGCKGLQDQLTADIVQVCGLVKSVHQDVLKSHTTISEHSQQIEQIRGDKRDSMQILQLLGAKEEDLARLHSDMDCLRTKFDEKIQKLQMELDASKRYSQETMESYTILMEKSSNDKARCIERENELKQHLAEEKNTYERLISTERNNIAILKKELELLSAAPKEDSSSKHMIMELQFKVSSLETEKLALQSKVKDLEVREDAKVMRIEKLSVLHDKLKEKMVLCAEKMQTVTNEKTTLEAQLNNLRSIHDDELSQALKKAKEEYIAERIQVERNATSLLQQSRDDRDQAIEERNKAGEELQQIILVNELNEKECARYERAYESLTDTNKILEEKNSQLKAEIDTLLEEKEAVTQARDQLKREMSEVQAKLSVSIEEHHATLEKMTKLELRITEHGLEQSGIQRAFEENQELFHRLTQDLKKIQDDVEAKTILAFKYQSMVIELEGELATWKNHWNIAMRLLFKGNEEQKTVEEGILKLKSVILRASANTPTKRTIKLISKESGGQLGMQFSPASGSSRVSGKEGSHKGKLSDNTKPETAALHDDDAQTSPLSSAPSSPLLVGKTSNKASFSPALPHLPMIPAFTLPVTVEVAQSSDAIVVTSSTGKRGDSDPVPATFIPSTIITTSPISSRVKRTRAEKEPNFYAEDESINGDAGASDPFGKTNIPREREKTSPSAKRKNTKITADERIPTSTRAPTTSKLPTKRVRQNRTSDTIIMSMGSQVEAPIPAPKRDDSSFGERLEIQNKAEKVTESPRRPNTHKKQQRGKGKKN